MPEDRETPADSSGEPFADLLDEMERKRRGETSEASSVDVSQPPSETPAIDHQEVFSETSYDAVNTDDLWEDLEDSSDEWDDVTSDPSMDGHDSLEVDVVPKRSYCQSCRHITDPPEFRCTHDGTEIVEFVDMEHVRVRNCPVAAERLAESEDR